MAAVTINPSTVSHGATNLQWIRGQLAALAWAHRGLRLIEITSRDEPTRCGSPSFLGVSPTPHCHHHGLTQTEATTLRHWQTLQLRALFRALARRVGPVIPT